MKPSFTASRGHHGRIEWPLAYMKPGQTCFVDSALRGFGEVYNYAKVEGVRRGKFFLVERTDGGTWITCTKERQSLRERKQLKRPEAPEGRAVDWGVIERPKDGRWAWPFRDMEVGDTFRVLPEAIPIGRMRQRAYNAGFMLGRHFSVLDSPLTAPGYILVQRVDEPRVGHDVTKFELVRQRLAEHYHCDDPRYTQTEGMPDDPDYGEFDLGFVPWFQLSEYQSIAVPLLQLTEPPRSCYVFEGVVDGGDNARFAVDLFSDRIEVTRIPLNVGVNEWQDLRLQEIME